MVKLSLLLLALPLVSASMRGAPREAEERFPKSRQLKGGSGGCPASGVSFRSYPFSNRFRYHWHHLSNVSLSFALGCPCYPLYK